MTDGNTIVMVDGVAYAVGEGPHPEVRYASGAPCAEETDAFLVKGVAEHVRHARRFSLPLGRVYGGRSQVQTGYDGTERTFGGLR